MLTIITRTSDRQQVFLDRQIASSNEGEVWETNFNGCLAKIYHQPTLEKIEKLKAMLANPLVAPMKYKNHISIAFPQDLLLDGDDNCIGFLMPSVRSSYEIASIYDPKLRKRNALGFNWNDLHVSALNIASIIQAIHEQGYVLGNINPQDILVNKRALVAVVNTDSFQVSDSQTGKVYRCTVKSDNFTPVELLGKDFYTTDQSEICDRFRLGVLIHYLLFGYHPFSNEQTDKGESTITEFICKGLWYGGNDNSINVSQTTIPLDIVHPEIKRLLLKCFNDGHASPDLRPTAEEWHHALQVAVEDLTICSQVDSHHYSQSYGKCYWCERKAIGVDLFPKAGNVAISSPTVQSSTPSNQTAQPSAVQSLSNYLSTQSPNRHQSPPVKSRTLPPKSNKLRNILLIGSAFLLLGFVTYKPLHSAWLLSAEIAAWKKVAVFKTLTGHSDVVESVAISPNGQILVSGSSDGTIKVWNLVTGLEIFTIKGHRDNVTSVAINPDGKTFVSCDGSDIKVWNLSTGLELLTITSKFIFANSIAISPDGQTLVSGSDSSDELRVWNLTTGNEIRPSTRSGGIEALAISPDGQTIIGGTSSKGVMVWNLATGERIRPLKGKAGYVTSIAISPDGQTVAGSSPLHGIIGVWNPSTGERIHDLKNVVKTFSDFVNVDPSEEFSAVAINPDGKILVSGSRDGTIKVWNLATSKEILSLKEHLKSISSVAISSDGHTLVSGSIDTTIKVWNIPR